MAVEEVMAAGDSPAPQAFAEAAIAAMPAKNK
jgi:hypothetical protein